jgi:pimeloyl-ACP methyl ester carboxylesterase
MKLCIKNRENKKIAVILEKSDNQKGLAFVMHGLGGFKEQLHVICFAKSFLESGFTVVRFDTTHTYGESEGKYEDATVTNYYEDLEDVIKWASSQDWYQEPFWLAGHSLGGISVALYALRFPDKVKGVAPVSTVVSGKLSAEGKESKIAAWKKSGWKEHESSTKPGLIKRLKWSHMEDRLKYDLVPDAGKLTMPVLMIVGEDDTSTPPKHQKILFDAIQGEKEMHVIKGAPHTFVDKEHLVEIRKIFLDWIKNWR